MIIWTFKAKVMAFILTVCVSVSFVTGFISYTSSKNALQDLAFTKLTAVRSAKSSELNIYLRNVKAEIQISQAFYDALEGEYATVLRGEIEVKGAGKMQTYLLQRPVEAVA